MGEKGKIVKKNNNNNNKILITPNKLCRKSAIINSNNNLESFNNEISSKKRNHNLDTTINNKSLLQNNNNNNNNKKKLSPDIVISTETEQHEEGSTDNVIAVVDITMLEMDKNGPKSRTNENSDTDDDSSDDDDNNNNNNNNKSSSTSTINNNSNNNNTISGNSEKLPPDDGRPPEIPEVLKIQGAASYCSNAENNCPCNTMEDVEQISKQINFCDRKTWVTVERLNELRKKALDAIKNHKTFTIRGCFFSVRNSLAARGWVEKLDAHRRHPTHIIFQTTYEDITQTLPKRRPGESRRQYLIKCERNIMSRFLEHMPIDFLWTARKEKCDWIDQAKNPLMMINKFHRVPFTTKEGLCGQLRDFHWFYEEGMAELRFPRCYNVWNPEELNDFIENFRLTGAICFLKWIVETFREKGAEAVFSEDGKVPISSIDFATKRCTNYLDYCKHNDIDNDENSVRIWEHDWDAFLTNHYILTHENARILMDKRRILESIIKPAEKVLRNIENHWPQYGLDGYLNIWIVKPANKCRGRGIHLMNNIKKIMNMVNPSTATKSRYVIQKYVERPLIIHNTKFDIRQWFLVTSAQPLVIWMYKESYLRFSSQEYSLRNYHESVHLTNHAVQKKYRNAKRDKRLPSENMWDCYTFQAYLKQIGVQEMWNEKIYPGMRSAIIGAMLASQENMDRRTNTFELFGADFIISEDFEPWLIEINSSPDLGGTTSVTARMCPQCLEDVIKVVIDRRADLKADTGNFEMIYRQTVPPTPAYMGLNLFLKGRQLTLKTQGLRREKTSTGFHYSKQQTSTNLSHASSTLSIPSQVSRSASPFQSTIFVEKGAFTGPYLSDVLDGSTPKENSNSSDMVFRKSPFDSCNNSNYLFKLDTAHNSPRLLTPNIFSSYRSESQNYVSPRAFSSNRRPSKEIIDLKNSSNETRLKPSQIIHNTASRRHLSCGPKIHINNEDVSAAIDSQYHHLPQEPKDSNQLTVENKFECIGNKYNVENLNITISDDGVLKTPPKKTPRTSSDMSNSREFFDLLCKEKTLKLKRSTKSAATVKPRKSSPNTLCNGAGNNSNISHCSRGNYLSSIKKLTNCENSVRNKIPKSPNLKNSNIDCISPPIHSLGMSLRAWKSRHYKFIKDNNSGNLQMNLIPCKSAPVTSPLRNGQLCKNLSKKLSGQIGRGNVGC